MYKQGKISLGRHFIYNWRVNFLTQEKNFIHLCLLAWNIWHIIDWKWHVTIRLWKEMFISFLVYTCKHKKHDQISFGISYLSCYYFMFTSSSDYICIVCSSVQSSSDDDRKLRKIFTILYLFCKLFLVKWTFIW